MSQPFSARGIASTRRLTVEIEPGITVEKSGSLSFETDSIERLDVSRTDVSDIESLRGLDRLRSLDLTLTDVSDLAPLGDLSMLSDLKLGGVPARDFEPLAGLDAVRRLDLSQTSFGDRDIGYLPSGVVSLDLSGTQVRDLVLLASVGSLRSLTLSADALRGESAAELRSARPEIVLSPGGPVFAHELRDVESRRSALRVLEDDSLGGGGDAVATFPARIHVGLAAQEMGLRPLDDPGPHPYRVSLVAPFLSLNAPAFCGPYHVETHGGIVRCTPRGESGSYRMSDRDPFVFEVRGFVDDRWEPGFSPHDAVLDRSPGVVCSRREILPAIYAGRADGRSETSCELPALRALARRHAMHYVERWPLLSLEASLGQSDERVPCEAMAVGPHGVLVVRRSMPDEQGADRGSIASCEDRNLRVENAVRACFSRELGGGSSSFPVHVLTLGIEGRGDLGPLDVHRSGSSGSSMGLGREGATLLSSHAATMVHHTMREASRVDVPTVDRLWVALMPSLEESASPDRRERTLSCALGATPMPAEGTYRGFSSEVYVFHKGRQLLQGDATALRMAIAQARTRLELDPGVPEVSSSRWAADVTERRLRALRREGLYGSPGSSVPKRRSRVVGSQSI